MMNDILNTYTIYAQVRKMYNNIIIDLNVKLGGQKYFVLRYIWSEFIDGKIYV